MAHYIKVFEPLWGEWKFEEKIGAGSYGNVWKVSRIKGTDKEYAAVKEVTVPASEEVLEEAKLEGLDREGAKLYFREILDKTLREVSLMKDLSECPNIVQFKECMVCDLTEKGNFGWVVFIQMELLKSAKDIFLNKNMSLHDVAKLGIDICHALETCEKKGIVHHDIKPDNLFYDVSTDTYKLGDFGIAKQLGRATAQKGRPGTLSYMSPELYQGEPSSPTTDLYALGMILYRLLNHFRMPLLPVYPKSFTPDERDQALLRRLNGAEPLSPHIGIEVDDALVDKAIAFGEIARKSISANPSARFENAAQLREAIQNLEI